VNSSLASISKEYNTLNSIYSGLPVQFYLIGTVFDSIYLDSFNNLQYNDLCAQSGISTAQCQTVLGESFGLNVIVSQYMSMVTAKYNSLISYASDGSVNST